MPRKTSLVVGSTGFVGSKIVKSLSEVEGETIALTRRSINDLPKNTKELLIKFDEDLSNLNLPECDHIYLSLGYDLYYWNVMGNFRAYGRKLGTLWFKTKMDKQYIV